jgi:hypothetical protein
MLSERKAKGELESTNLEVDGQVEEVISSLELLLNREQKHLLAVLVGDVWRRTA